MDEDLMTNDEVIVMGVPIETDAELDGLGRRFNVPMSKNTRRMLRANSNRRLKRSFQFQNLNKGQRQLNVKMSKLPKQTQLAAREDNLQFFDGLYYIRREITGGGADVVINLFDDTIDQVVGISNLSKAKLAEYVNLMMQRVEMQYFQSVTITDVKEAEFEPLEAGSVDNALMNGEMEISCGGVSLLRIPINKIVDGDPDVGDSLANGYNIKSPKLVTEQRKIQISFYMAGTLSVIAGLRHFVEISLIGNETKLSQKN